ncbi:MAG: PEP-CTERM sorting domain-containing protein [Okeania sp. SIO3I5]|uniref:PKD domain-containing protein n=1 Tax=Okeania sp. SIO3I5 TaxID=2607805 RepID=UPI0013BA75D8|nr:PKD domain-containing protein [Okeania sp. SIO3I5]NEQ39133.1 PEP-CTERM sorting domain-containing protein [Okeania sp. SIO3I5]
MSNQKHPLVSQATLAVVTTFSLFSASAANAASLNVLWYGQTDAYNAEISELAALAPTFDPAGDGSLNWNLTFWNPEDPTPTFSDYDVLAIGTGSKRGVLDFDPTGILNNKEVISEARGNRTFLTGQDADNHYTGNPGPRPNGPLGFLINAVNWAGSGEGMGIVALTDGWGPRDRRSRQWWLNDRSFLKDELEGYVSYFETNRVVIPTETSDFAVNEGLTTGGLSNWRASAHAAFNKNIPGYLSINDAGSRPGYAVTIVTASEADGDTLGLETVPTLESFLINGQSENINIFEGELVSATLSATDIDQDALDVYVNNQKLSTNTSSGSSGTISTTVQLGPFPDDGSYTQTAEVRDEDGVVSETVTRTVNVKNVAPTLQGFNLSNSVINEGDSAFAELFATDPGADSISFFLNDENIGTDTRTSGNRLTRTNLGVFADDGTFTYTGRARDDDGGISNTLTRTLTVNNLDPIITSLTEDFTIRTNTTFDFASTATDPGINDILTFDWDFDGDGLFDDFTGSSGEWSFSRSGIYAMNLRVSDGDGGVAFASFQAKAVPEPGSVFGLLTLGVLGVGSRLRKRKF